MIVAHPTTTVQVYLLGSFRVVIAGKQLDDAAWRRRKARQLFKYLLNRPRRRMLKEEAMEVFWPESEPEAASSNLRTSIYALRQALKPAGDDFIVEDRE